MKRADYISWDQYFMGIAMMSAERSKDPSTQVGACIVDKNNRILSMGYNGMPAGCDDDVMPWGKVGNPLDNKYFYVCHAELNSILNYRGGNLKMPLYIRHCFLAMSVPKQSFSAASRKLYTCRTSMLPRTAQ